MTDKRIDEMASPLLPFFRRSKANVDAKSNDGDRPLHQAPLSGRTESAKLLVENRADVNAQDNSDDTPLPVAERKGRRPVAELLHQHGGHE